MKVAETEDEPVEEPNKFSSSDSRSFNQFAKTKTGHNQITQLKQNFVITLIIRTNFFKNKYLWFKTKNSHHYTIIKLCIFE